jgi:hypothetical protein
MFQQSSANALKAATSLDFGYCRCPHFRKLEEMLSL